VKILVLSDTHIPRAASDLPQEVYEYIQSVDMILHAGDFSEMRVLENLKKMKKTVAVCGNMDSEDIKRTLNHKETIKAGKYKIGLIHGYGPPSSLSELVQREFKNVDVIVYGHSHTPTNFVKDGVLFFNPGSPTDKVFATYNSYGILHLTEKSIKGEIVKIGT
jgi:putative phosphoesterase